MPSKHTGIRYQIRYPRCFGEICGASYVGTAGQRDDGRGNTRHNTGVVDPISIESHDVKVMEISVSYLSPFHEDYVTKESEN